MDLFLKKKIRNNYRITTVGYRGRKMKKKKKCDANIFFEYSLYIMSPSRNGLFVRNA